MAYCTLPTIDIDNVTSSFPNIPIPSSNLESYTDILNTLNTAANPIDDKLVSTFDKIYTSVDNKIKELFSRGVFTDGDMSKVYPQLMQVSLTTALEQVHREANFKQSNIVKAYEIVKLQLETYQAEVTAKVIIPYSAEKVKNESLKMLVDSEIAKVTLEKVIPYEAQLKCNQSNLILEQAIGESYKNGNGIYLNSIYAKEINKIQEETLNLERAGVTMNITNGNGNISDSVPRTQAEINKKQAELYATQKKSYINQDRENFMKIVQGYYNTAVVEEPAAEYLLQCFRSATAATDSPNGVDNMLRQWGSSLGFSVDIGHYTPNCTPMCTTP